MNVGAQRPTKRASRCDCSTSPSPDPQITMELAMEKRVATRKELEEHYYNPVFQGLIDIGVTPSYLTDNIIEEIFQVVEKYAENIRKEVVFKGIKW